MSKLKWHTMLVLWLAFCGGYPNAPHVGATAWYIFAERELNPYWGLNTCERIQSGRIMYK